MRVPFRDHAGWDMSLQTKSTPTDYRSRLFEAVRSLHIVSLDQINEVIDAVLSVDPEDATPAPAALRYDRRFAADGIVIK
ncbi:hypothetical protein NS234_04965 [Microbacterium oxydans]|uniref:hypothetical protein n=1 Tax=Microbacterium oxydans TaxID=82380 RepID=UPI0007345E05|nr:hypothetical protein [Microbacterium oxydans]KTR78020.1 hypothetical protein NS234_04965 [Microbacterium oxydans]